MQIWTVTTATSSMDSGPTSSTKVIKDQREAQRYFEAQIKEAEGEVESQTSNSCTLRGEGYPYDDDTQIDLTTHEL